MHLYLLVQDNKVYKRGVVQALGPFIEEWRGFNVGETVYYTKPTIKTEHGDYVDIENLICLIPV